MKHAVLTRTFSPPLASPMTYDHWMQMHQTLDGCLEARHVHWLYSLISTQGDRSVCLFQVPYADAVREACRESCMPFQKAWQAEPWVERDVQTLPPGTSLVVADVIFDPPMTKTRYDSTKDQAVNCLKELNVQPITSLIALNGRDSICLFIATSAENVRSFYRKLDKPFEQVWKAILIRPV